MLIAVHAALAAVFKNREEDRFLCLTEFEPDAMAMRMGEGVADTYMRVTIDFFSASTSR